MLTLTLSLYYLFFKGEKIKINLRVFWYFMAAALVILIGAYVVQVNLLSQEIYSIQSLEKNFNKLSLENENLKIQFAEVNSLENLQTLIAGLDFEKVNRINYIKVLESSVAANK